MVIVWWLGYNWQEVKPLRTHTRTRSLPRLYSRVGIYASEFRPPECSLPSAHGALPPQPGISPSVTRGGDRHAHYSLSVSRGGLGRRGGGDGGGGGGPAATARVRPSTTAAGAGRESEPPAPVSRRPEDASQVRWAGPGVDADHSQSS